MSRICTTILFAACCSMAQAQQAEEWLTIHGFPDQPGGDLIQVNPTRVAWQDQFTIEVRVSRGAVRTGYRDVPYRSFKAIAVMDCSTMKGWYLSIHYYAQPLWQGKAVAKEAFKADEAPVSFNSIPGDPARRLVAAACKPR